MLGMYNENTIIIIWEIPLKESKNKYTGRVSYHSTKDTAVIRAVDAVTSLLDSVQHVSHTPWKLKIS